MSVQIPVQLLPLLRKVIAIRCPSLQKGLLEEKQILILDTEEAFTLRQALTDELCESGLDEGDEPTARGHDIECLIDLVGQVN